MQPIPVWGTKVCEINFDEQIEIDVIKSCGEKEKSKSTKQKREQDRDTRQTQNANVENESNLQKESCEWMQHRFISNISLCASKLSMWGVFQ